MRLSLVNSLQTPPGRHGLLIGENSWLSKCCFHLTLIFLTLIFVGFRPSKIHMALSLKTRNFNFGDPTTPRTPSSEQREAKFLGPRIQMISILGEDTLRVQSKAEIPTAGMRIDCVSPIRPLCGIYKSAPMRGGENPLTTLET